MRGWLGMAGDGTAPRSISDIYNDEQKHKATRSSDVFSGIDWHYWE